jgi:DUF438 domain-containing protein
MSTTLDRQKRIVEILTLLHKGGSFEEAKRIFNEEFDGVDVTEITAAEKALMQSGLDASEIQKLCNIHASVFKGSIKDIHHSNLEHEQPGHPVHTLKLENKVIQSLLDDEIKWVFEKIEKGDWSYRERLLAALTDLLNIDKHYARKETLIFTYMEKYGITAPPKVMWGVDDSVRAQIKDVIEYVKSEKAAVNPLREKLEALTNEIEEMIFKEEEIMTPMTLDTFSLKDWEKIAEDSFAIGFSFIADPLPWKASPDALAKEAEREPERLAAIKKARETTDGIAESMEGVESPAVDDHYDWENSTGKETIVLPTGTVKLNEMIAMFNLLPVDLTFVGADERVKFFSEGDRVFPRTKSIIGREVVNCHPPKSMHVVQTILDDFRNEVRDTADFWIEMRGKFIYIRYFAMRDVETNEYLGCLEVTQDITEIKKIEGQHRLLDTLDQDGKPKKPAL